MKFMNSLKFRFTLGVFVIVTTVAVVFSLVSYEYEKRAIQNRLYAQLNAVADLKKEQVVKYLAERTNDLKTLSESRYQRRNLSVLLAPGGDALAKKAAAEQLFLRLKSYKSIHLGYRNFMVMDLHGGVLATTEAGARARHSHQEDLRRYAEDLRQGATLVLQHSMGSGYIDLIAGMPDEHGRVRAALVGHIGLSEALYPFFSDYTGLGRTGETSLMRRDGRGATCYITPTRNEPVAVDGASVSEGEYQKLALLSTEGNEGIDEGIDHRGKAVIGAYRHIPGLGWGVVTKLDADEAFADIRALRRRTLAFTLATLAVMLGLAYLVGRKLMSPISELISKTKEIAAGSYAVQVKSGRTDELGELEENFNEMVAALEASQRENEQIQNNLADLVSERTENLARANADLSQALEDIKRENEEKKSLQAQLLHAQKMEAVGTLAGGIAHDFNNILTAITGYGNVMLMKLKDEDPHRKYLDQILAASERAANLTRGLLAFSRKQISSPRPLALNEAVDKVRILLAPIMGEDIELKAALSDADPTVMADAGQLEQVLMNLATNARDAMPRGGCFTIATDVARIDDRHAAVHGDCEPGEYAVVIVSDTGCGMDERTRARIFEPFFTTKETGKGTGLGLSIAYGIVKTQNGFINCYSEPGAGTAFRIYLPLIVRDTGLREPAVSSRLPRGGSETILVAEDNVEVRDLSRTILTQFGYTVIEAVDGEDAVRKFAQHRDSVHLLLFDIIMPKKNGKEAHDEIRAMKPGVKVIFTSGYTADVIRDRGFIDNGFPLLAKPLSPRDLLEKIREVLDGA